MRAARGGPARALAASRRAPALRAVPRIAHGASPAAAPRVTLAKPLRLAVLNSPGNDPYAPLFERFVGAALADSAALRVASFETAAGQLPPLDDDAFDGFILSGSRHGAYEQLPWIAELLAWTRRAVAARKRLLGVCFGHQARVAALHSSGGAGQGVLRAPAARLRVAAERSGRAGRASRAPPPLPRSPARRPRRACHR